MGHKVKKELVPISILRHGGNLGIKDIEWGYKYTLENPSTGYKESIRLRKEINNPHSVRLEYLFNNYLYYHNISTIRGT